jgi:hypothetical protein
VERVQLEANDDPDDAHIQSLPLNPLIHKVGAGYAGDQTRFSWLKRQDSGVRVYVDAH